MTFYLKYRPQSLEELDLDSVRQSLTKVVSSAKIPHAFLFSGPKGTGKTSAARIIAKVVNCESPKNPCNKCGQCKSITRGVNLDVIEIDAASHRGIDDIRLLRDAVKLAPALGKKKVYIIDEAHMLTVEASNALLKTLEEPPAHVMFILATTNPEKLIGTIRSRTTEIFFGRPTIKEIFHSLAKVVRGEKIKITDDSLNLIAKTAGGSFRDATKILEQVILEKKPLDIVSLEKYLAGIGKGGLADFLGFLARREVKNALKEIEKTASQGTSQKNFLEELLICFRLGLLAKVGVGTEDLAEFEKGDLICLIELFSRAAEEIATSPIEQLPTELAIIKWCGQKLEAGSLPAQADLKSEVREEPSLPAKEKKVDLPRAKLGEINDEMWKSILAQVRPINTSIEALLRAAKPMGFDGKVLTLGVYYRFHKERLEEGAHRRVLEDVAAAVLGNPVRVVCTLTEPPQKPLQPESPQEAKAALTEGEDKDIIKIAEEIFGN